MKSRNNMKYGVFLLIVIMAIATINVIKAQSPEQQKPIARELITSNCQYVASSVFRGSENNLVICHHPARMSTVDRGNGHIMYLSLENGREVFRGETTYRNEKLLVDV